MTTDQDIALSFLQRVLPATGPYGARFPALVYLKGDQPANREKSREF
jgi:hypothetical protein